MPQHRIVRTAAAALTATVLGALTWSASAGPAHAATAGRAQPGSLAGYAFDTCQTPDQATMDAWRTGSPFSAVGVYIGGENRAACTADGPDADWVAAQLARGWHLLPLWVGPQDACATSSYAVSVDKHPRDSYAAAGRQGRREADRAATAARSLGIAAGSALFYDMEDYRLADDDCRRSALTLLSAWTRRLHHDGFLSGVYSNVAAAVTSIDYADEVSPRAYAEPDLIWYAWANGRADTAIDDHWVRPTSWTPHRRLHQYAVDEQLSYGGYPLTADVSYLDVGRGADPAPETVHCARSLDFRGYGPLRHGAHGPRVFAAQCLLRHAHHFRGRVTGRFDSRTARGTRALQRRAGLRPTGVLDRRTWTALSAVGPRPLLKVGSTGEAVRRLQRALNGAPRAGLAVTGVFDAATVRKVGAYQHGLGLPRTGVVTHAVWDGLQSGRA